MATSNPYDPDAVVANSSRPRQVVNRALEIFSVFLRARVDAATMAAAKLKTKFTDNDRSMFERMMRYRALYGRGWWRRFNETLPHQGKQEIRRRLGQIERGLIQPVYRYDGTIK